MCFEKNGPLLRRAFITYIEVLPPDKGSGETEEKILYTFYTENKNLIRTPP